MIRNRNMSKVGVALATIVLAAIVVLAGHAQRSDRGPGRDSRGGFGPRIAQELGLTDAQKSQIQEYMKDTRSQLDVLRNDTALTREQRREKAQQIRETTQAKLTSVLTPDQQAKAEQLRQQRQQQMQERRERAADRRMEQMATRLGLSASQSESIKSLLDQQRTQAGAIRDNTSLTREQRREQLQALGQQSRDQIRATLTADQQAKLDELREQAQQRFENRRRRGRGPQGGPSPMGFRL